ncbi:MAG TPA: TadE/TadG family type IV pilus assembly protein [Herpetosiphonaceae bacterium]
MKRLAQGQSIVELALLLPFLILMTIGTMEIGYYVYTYSELENATRRASEWAAKTPPFTVSSSDDNAGDKCAVLIKEHALDGVFLSDLTYNNITISYPSGSTRNPGKLIQVQLTYQGEWLSPIGQRFLGEFLNFNFTARRTIVSTGAPPGLNPDCS